MRLFGFIKAVIVDKQWDLKVERNITDVEVRYFDQDKNEFFYTATTQSGEEVHGTGTSIEDVNWYYPGGTK